MLPCGSLGRLKLTWQKDGRRNDRRKSKGDRSHICPHHVCGAKIKSLKAVKCLVPRDTGSCLSGYGSFLIVFIQGMMRNL